MRLQRKGEIFWLLTARPPSCLSNLLIALKLCSEDCGNCQTLVLKDLPCGHQENAPCYMVVESVHCESPCQKILPCGHSCKNKCSLGCTTDCKVEVDKILKCGHIVQGPCFKKPEHIFCSHLVFKQWPNCDHEVEVHCSKDPFTTPCPVPCEKVKIHL